MMVDFLPERTSRDWLLVFYRRYVILNRSLESYLTLCDSLRSISNVCWYVDGYLGDEFNFQGRDSREETSLQQKAKEMMETPNYEG